MDICNEFFLSRHIYVYEQSEDKETLFSGCNSVGDVFDPSNYAGKRIYGNIGFIEASTEGRATFRLEDNVIKLVDVIGRSLVITEQTNNEHERVACGIIARSAGLFENPKKICACDGVTLWDEVSKLKPKS